MRLSVPPTDAPSERAASSRFTGILVRLASRVWKLTDKNRATYANSNPAVEPVNRRPVERMPLPSCRPSSSDAILATDRSSVLFR